MDFHSDQTSISGFIGGKALYNIKDKFKEIYILGVRDIEPGEPENLRDNPHVHLVSSVRFIPPELCHLHIDGDVFDPTINPTVDYPVKHGWNLDDLTVLLCNLNYGSSSVSNLSGKLLKHVTKRLVRYGPSVFIWEYFYW